jgi:hypothetical protein
MRDSDELKKVVVEVATEIAGDCLSVDITEESLFGTNTSKSV